MAEHSTGGLLAGFDSGQTHTACRLSTASDPDLTLVEGRGAGVSHLSAAEEAERFRLSLSQSLRAAW